MNNFVEIIKHEKFGDNVTADKRRDEFDLMNEVILVNQIPVDFVFIGDSITQKWELNAYFGKTGKVALNRGIGGETAYHVLRRFHADVIQLTPKYAILEVGINDTWSIDGHGGSPEDSSEPWTVGERVLQYIRKMIEIAAENKQGLILASIPPTGDIEWAPRKKDRNEVVRKLNGELKKMARQFELIFVDYHSEMIEEDGISLRAELSYDGVHPHVQGYNIMSQVLKKTLLQQGIEI